MGLQEKRAHTQNKIFAFRMKTMKEKKNHRTMYAYNNNMHADTKISFARKKGRASYFPCDLFALIGGRCSSVGHTGRHLYPPLSCNCAAAAVVAASWASAAGLDSHEKCMKINLR